MIFLFGAPDSQPREHGLKADPITTGTIDAELRLGETVCGLNRSCYRCPGEEDRGNDAMLFVHPLELRIFRYQAE